MVECEKTTLKPSTKGKCLLGDSENGKVQKDSPEAINKGKSAFWEIAKMVKYKETTLKPLTKGKVPFGR